MDQIIDNTFAFKASDIIQIYDGGTWTDLGTIRDSRAAAVDFYLNNGKIFGKPARVVRRK